ncbi:MAG: hypothetical protein SF029_06425 [bacterium]|nr:hypothetical protein [bacterium]
MNPTENIAHPVLSRTINPRMKRWLPLLLVAWVLLALVLPRPYSDVLFLTAVLLSVTVVLNVRLHREITVRVPALPAALRCILETGVVLVCLLVLTTHLQEFSSGTRLNGGEFSYLIGSGAVASQIYQRTGAVPLWNPFMRQGEPLVENPFAFMLNPLMSLPVLELGPAAGAKVALFIHIPLLAVGGWFLASVLGLRAPGRMLLAALLGGSGSLTGMMGEGFYQMALSQVYVPWVYAGLIGTLYPQHHASRWPPVLLAVATMLLLFSGTYWFALPTAIGCALLMVFYALSRPPVHDFSMALRRVAFALVLMLGLSAARLLPQIVHHGYVEHLNEEFRRSRNLTEVMQAFFAPRLPDGVTNRAIYYHYILPLPFLLVVVPGLILGARRWWRVIVPALLLIVLFVLWAQESSPLIDAAYRTFPFLREWRFTTRMLAAGAVWVAVLAAIGLDEAVRHAQQEMRVNIGRALLAAVILLFAAFTTLDVMTNWQRTVWLLRNDSLNRLPMVNLRVNYPDEFLSVMTPDFWDYLPFYETLTRAAYGNPDYWAGALPATQGEIDFTLRTVRGQYGLAYPGLDGQDAEDLQRMGYQRLDNVGLWYDWWYNPEALPYAALLNLDDIQRDSPAFLTSLTIPLMYDHNIDSVRVYLDEATLDELPAGQFAIVVQETAYPGWTVRVNGQPAPVESIGGILGVVVPEGAHTVEFIYQPTWFYAGAIITLASAGLTIVYLLRGEHLLKWIMRGRKS